MLRFLLFHASASSRLDYLVDYTLCIVTCRPGALHVLCCNLQVYTELISVST